MVCTGSCRTHLRHVARVRRLLHGQRRAALVCEFSRRARAAFRISAACGHGHAGAIFAGTRRVAALRTDKYSEDDGLILIPGEDPFYFATGRVPRFPVLLFDPTTDPYSPAETAALVRSQNIRWLIVKRDLQMKEDPTPDRAELMTLLMKEFTLAAHLHGYDVYRR